MCENGFVHAHDLHYLVFSQIGYTLVHKPSHESHNCWEQILIAQEPETLQFVSFLPKWTFSSSFARRALLLADPDLLQGCGKRGEAA